MDIHTPMKRLHHAGRRLFAALAAVLGAVLRHATAERGAASRVTTFVRRADFFSHSLLRPEDLLETWCGNPPEFALLDRLSGRCWSRPVSVLGFATVLGWLGDDTSVEPIAA